MGNYPESISTFRIVGRLMAGKVDSADAGDAPDLDPVAGAKIICTPDLTPAIYKIPATNQIVYQQPVPAITDEDGYIVAAAFNDANQVVAGTGGPLDLIFGGDTDITPNGWTWTITIEAIGSFPARTFTVTGSAGGTIKLANVVPVPANPGADLVQWTQAVTATQAARDAAIDAKNDAEAALAAMGKGQANGTASLDGSVKVPHAQINVASIVADPQLSAAIGDALAPRGRWDAQIIALLSATLNNAAKYTLNVYWPTVFPGSSPITDWTGTTEHYIRHPAASAWGVAALIASGQYDQAVTGVSEAAATTACVRMIDSLTSTHKANGGTWGGNREQYPATDNEQAGLWASLTTLAGLALWESLSVAQQGRVDAVVTWEADRCLDWPTWPVWRNTAGTTLLAGSYAEETAWMAMPLAVEIATHPTGDDVRSYQQALARMCLFQNSVPADQDDDLPVNGLTPSDLPGSNVLADGLIVNHDIVHPDYSVSAGATLFQTLWLLGSAGVSTPGSFARHTDLMYRALSQRVISTGEVIDADVDPALAPGGTIYPWPMRTGFYYPQGNDWGSNPKTTADKAAFDVLAYRYGWDRGLNPSAGEWAVQHLTDQLALQQRFSTGQTYTTGDASEHNYGIGTGTPSSDYAREAWVGHHLAGALLAMLNPVLGRDFTHYAEGQEPEAWDTAIAASEPGMWWKLDEASGTTFADSSGNSRPGTLNNVGTDPTYNTATIVPSEAGNGSITLAGGTRIRNTSVAWLSGLSRTFAVVFKRNGNPASSERFLAQASSSATTTRLIVATFQTDGKLNVTARQASTTNFATAVTDSSVCDNAAHLLILTVTKGGVFVWLDGALVEYLDFANANLGSTDAIALGSYSDGANPATGVYEDFIVWPRALHEAEVADLYRAFTGE